MKVAKTAKRGAKGWAGYKAAKGATKGASKAVRRKRRGPSTRERVAKLAGAVGITAGVAFLLSKIDRRKAVGRAKGAVSSVGGGRDYDDVTLARKVETELFRPADVPKGSISVNVNDGVVELRGELPDQSQIDELGDTAKKIDGVKDVRNLLSTSNSG
ncbi:MAG TPA: BON domain-containing protein [Solirubrobacteraceae bacterium]|nr:BON domain-containing protein [Solirubrobacteraceae bacterium]